ncbi:MAG TPA: virulence RhuM family protein [Flavobacterium sp.]|nr:virulence RhuM family protein [Flavobacterium sp.]
MESNIIIYNTQDGKANVALLAKDGKVWMNQNQLAELFDTSKQNIGQHIASILEDKELDENSVVKNYFTTATDGKQYEVMFYSLEMILAIGFRVRSKRGVQFRIWANQNLKEYMIKGFLMDDERLKNPEGRPDYFDELLERIREIRTSEKRFYQKVKDLLSLSSDYDATDKSTQLFFAETQNKLLYAVTQKTAAELIVSRANADAPNMALTTWQGSKVRKQDIIIAKNYLSKDEIDTLNRLTIIFLETAELRVKERKDITLNFWRENVDRILQFNDREILKNAGAVSKKQMEEQVRLVY